MPDALSTRGLLGYFLLIACLVVAPAWAKPKVLWLTTLKPNLQEASGFWVGVHDVIHAAAEDLDVEFETLYTRENHIKMVQDFQSIVRDPAKRPDAVLLHNFKGQAEAVLKLAEAAGVYSFVFNSSFKGNLLPRSLYRRWVGEMYPDDVTTGYALAKILESQARKRGMMPTDDSIPMIGIAGLIASPASQARVKGAEAWLKESQHLTSSQFFHAQWARDRADWVFTQAIQRYPGAKIAWAANDNMALGILDAMKRLRLKPGEDVLIGGVDWLDDVLPKIRQNQVAVSMGGHFIEGAWALILTYDYLRGKDFSAVVGTTIHTRMLALTQENLARFGDLKFKLSKENLRKIDFRTYSRFHNPALSEYPFDIGEFLKQL